MQKKIKGKFVLSFDFGGTKLAAAVINRQTGELLSYYKTATPTEEGAEASIQKITVAGKKVLQEFGVESFISQIGISFGGPVSKNQRRVLHSHHIQKWDNYPLTDKFSKIFGLPALMENDANAAALGEWYFGAGERTNNMVYIQVSTGVGAGLIIDRRLYRGNGLAGEFGHITILPNGPICTCGRKGCMESLCSGWAIARDGKIALEKSRPDEPLFQLSNGEPNNIDAKLLIETWRQGDINARAVLQQSFYFLAIGITNMIELFDPDIVVLGGGITKADDAITKLLLPQLQENLHPLFRNRTTVKFSNLQGRETLMGAALLFEENL